MCDLLVRHSLALRLADESDASMGDSLIFSVTQPVSYSFACHLSCKVKYFGKVAKV